MCAIMILINLFIGENYMPKFNSIDGYFEIATTVTTYVDGKICEYEASTDEYTNILNMLRDICKGSREMPAYGVSLNQETKAEMQKGIWVELGFSKMHTHNEMPFDSLLIEVQPHFQGFNLIRGQNKIYEGRCFHIYSPQTTMEKLYDFLQNL